MVIGIGAECYYTQIKVHSYATCKCKANDVCYLNELTSPYSYEVVMQSATQFYHLHSNNVLIKINSIKASIISILTFILTFSFINPIYIISTISKLMV